MTESMITKGAEAMKVKRRELIAQPLERIWPDLMRAAIEAMREPTSEMSEAIWQKTGDPCWLDDAVRAWQAGIDTALSEKP